MVMVVWKGKEELGIIRVSYQRKGKEKGEGEDVNVGLVDRKERGAIDLSSACYEEVNGYYCSDSLS